MGSYQGKSGVAREFLRRLPRVIGEYDQRLQALADEIESVRSEYALWVLAQGREDEEHARRLAARVYVAQCRLHTHSLTVAGELAEFAFGSKG